MNMIQTEELKSKVTSDENLLLALRNLRFNKGSKTPGTDGKTTEQYAKMETKEYLETIKAKLENYQPQPVRRVEIPKPNGKTRPLGIPTMEDRIIQQAIKQVIEPIIEPQFSGDSYAFRPNRSASHAVAALSKHINIGKLSHVVDIDIEGFFDNVVHHTLLRQLWRLGIQDGEIIEIIARMLKAEIAMPNGDVIKPTKGTPQGGIISPLLANVMLNDLDQWINSYWRNRPTEHQYSQTGHKYRALRRAKRLKHGT